MHKYVISCDVDDIIPEYTNTSMRLVAILSTVLFQPGNSRSRQRHQNSLHDYKDNSTMSSTSARDDGEASKNGEEDEEKDEW